MVKLQEDKTHQIMALLTKDKVEKGEVDVQCTPTDKMLSNMFTKWEKGLGRLIVPDKCGGRL